jgi:4-hydroxymandelate oxidase
VRDEGLAEILHQAFERRVFDRDNILKALAMGAQGVCVGRAYIWGLGAFGKPGVERVLELLCFELRVAMQQVGAPTIKHLVPALVRRG